MANKKVLLMFSGGIDSLGALYLLLTDKQYADMDIHVHHMHLHNIENRHYAEKKAVDAIINKLKTSGFRDFDYTESLHYIPKFSNNFLYDSDLVAFMASMIMLCDKSITHYATGVTLSDTRFGIANNHIESTIKVCQTLTPLISRIRPVASYLKEDIIKFLPKDILNLAWSCRNPKYDNDGNAIKCNRCKTCIVMQGLTNE